LGIARVERDGTRAETRFRLSPKRTSPFKSVGASVQSTADSRGVHISFSNAGYTTFGGGLRVLATHSIRQFPLPCVTVCHEVPNELYYKYGSVSRHAVRLYAVPGHAGVTGNEIVNRLARSDSGKRFIGPEPFLGVSRQNIRRMMKRWMKKQHRALWRGPCSTQRQARGLISGPKLVTGARLLSFNRTQSRAVIGLLTRHNNMRRHLHVMGLSNNPTCRTHGIEDERSVHIFCECEALASLMHRYLGSFLLDREDIRVLGLGTIWNFLKGTGIL